MGRYCKICGAKSGRCNHLVVDFGERQDKNDSNTDNSDNKKSENQK